ncbi:hypothetical protein IE988_29505 [Klebsiella pneumoniae]|uniref:Uncharacterized protein n=1 Tax=Klebsiella pneumoniae TaxID=573 RepID=A0A927HUJ6_KLEPN|nr:hypothetical protein [Klebsiella pneumoniae]
MEHVKGKIQQGQGTPILQGCSGAVLHLDTPMLQRLISLISISAKLRHPKHALVASEQSRIHRSDPGH